MKNKKQNNPSFTWESWKALAIVIFLALAAIVLLPFIFAYKGRSGEQKNKPKNEDNQKVKDLCLDINSEINLNYSNIPNFRYDRSTNGEFVIPTCNEKSKNFNPSACQETKEKIREYVKGSKETTAYVKMRNQDGALFQKEITRILMAFKQYDKVTEEDTQTVMKLIRLAPLYRSASFLEKNKMGHCTEITTYTARRFLESGNVNVKTLHLISMEFKNSDHIFLLVNGDLPEGTTKKFTSVQELMKNSKDAVVCDPWSRKSYVALDTEGLSDFRMLTEKFDIKISSIPLKVDLNKLSHAKQEFFKEQFKDVIPHTLFSSKQGDQTAVIEENMKNQNPCKVL